MREQDHDDDVESKKQLAAAIEGKFFQMKRRRLSEDDDNDQAIKPIDEEKCGEDFHNPMYDSKLVDQLGRFN